jgi:hypothetical protein
MLSIPGKMAETVCRVQCLSGASVCKQPTPPGVARRLLCLDDLIRNKVRFDVQCTNENLPRQNTIGHPIVAQSPRNLNLSLPG